MDDKTKYVLELSPKQAQLVSYACEFLCRLRMGQLNNLEWELITYPATKSQKDLIDYGEKSRHLINEMKKLYFPELRGEGHSYGVGHDDRADMAWDIYQVIRHCMSWHDHPEGGWTVNFDKPFQYGSEPLAKCTAVKKGV